MIAFFEPFPFKLSLFPPFFFNNFYNFLMCLLPSPHFQFPSLCSVPLACWKDPYRLLYATVIAYWVFIEWDLSTGQYFPHWPGFDGKENTVCELSGSYCTLQKFSLQVRISYSNNVCGWLTNRTSREKFALPCKKNTFLDNFFIAVANAQTL